MRVEEVKDSYYENTSKLIEKEMIKTETAAQTILRKQKPVYLLL